MSQAPSQLVRIPLNQKLAARQEIEAQLNALRQRQIEIEAVSTLEQQRAAQSRVLRCPWD